MTTAATSLLGLALPVTGELAGTWGDTVNDSITSLLDTAVAGTTTLSTDGDVTLSTTTLAANQARQAILLCSGARTALRTITAPAQSKIYTIINATTGGYSVKLVGVGPTTGVTIVAGESALVAWNGSDFIKISNTGGAASFTNVTVSGTTTLSGLTASTALALNASKEVVSVTNTGTGNNVLSASPTLTGTIGAAALTLSSDLTLSGGTANGVLYLNGSKVATSGSALTFDGTNFATTGKIGAGGNPGTYTQIWSSGNVMAADGSQIGFLANSAGAPANYMTGSNTSNYLAWIANNSEQMRLTSTGLGIGTSSPQGQLSLGSAAGGQKGLTLDWTGAGGPYAVASFTADRSTGEIRNFAYTNFFQTWYSNNTEKMRLDTSGNLGLGVTPSAWGGNIPKAFQLGTTVNLANGYNSTYLSNNGYNNSSNQFIYQTTGNTFGMYSIQAGSSVHVWYIAPSGTAGNAITLTQAMTLGVDGTLGVGTTSAVSADGTLVAAGSGGTGQGTANTVAQINIWETTSGNKAGLWFGAMTNSNVGVIGSRTASGAIAFQTYNSGWAERARIDSSGNFLVGATSAVGKFTLTGPSSQSPTLAIQTLTGGSDTKAGTIGFYRDTTLRASILLDAADAGFKFNNPDVYGFISFLTAGGERARIDSSGNLGLGVTPSAWGSGYKSLDIGSVASFFSDNNVTANVSANQYIDAGGRKYKTTNYATMYQQYNGEHQWYNAASGTAGNAITFTQAMTLDASGRLAVGATSVTNGTAFGGSGQVNVAKLASTGYPCLQISTSTGGGSSVQFTNSDTVNGVIGYNASGGTNEFTVNNALSGALTFATNNTERARIDSSGVFTVGTTSKTTDTDIKLSNDGRTYGIRTDRATGRFDIVDFTAGSVRASIDSSGNLLVGTTSQVSSGFLCLQYAGNARNGIVSDDTDTGGGGNSVLIVRRNGTQIGSISTTTTATAYNTSSDYRLKENIQPMTGALAKVTLLKPVTYKWKADGSDGEGFIAHELQAVVPQCVTGEKDAVDEEGNPVYQGIDTSFLVATLTAALQEAHSLIKDLQTRIAALEAK